MPNPIAHTALGTGHCLGATGSATAIVIIALAVTAVAVALLAWDGMFLYSYAQKGLAHLIWCIPITLIFVGFDMMFVSAIARATTKVTEFLADRTKEHYQGMRSHYRSVCNNAA